MSDGWFLTPVFRPIPHLLTPPDPTILSPFAYLVEALDLLGRAHTLQSQTFDASDARAVDRRRDASVTLTSAAKRWFSDLIVIREGPQGALSLMIVRRFSFHGGLADPDYSKQSITREFTRTLFRELSLI